MADIYDRAEELNQVSALYNVEIDGVPLQQMSTNELAKVRTSAMLRPPLRRRWISPLARFPHPSERRRD
jgi:hypothetical protein